MAQGARLGRARGLPLFWRVCLANGAVFAVGTAVLAASPATVSAPVLAREALVLAVGLTVMLVANGLLLRAMLGPLDRLRHLMEDVDLLRPGHSAREDRRRAGDRQAGRTSRRRAGCTTSLRHSSPSAAPSSSAA